MIPERPEKMAGSALIWQAVQMGGVKVIFLLRILVLARLLLPEDFGMVAIATTAMGFLLNVTNFGMIPALVQGEEDSDRHYHTAWTFGLLRSLLISGLMVLAAPLIAQIFNEPEAVTFIQVIALIPLVEALGSIRIAHLNRHLLFRPLAVLRLANAVGNTVISVLVALQFGVWGLVAGMLAGALINASGSYLLAPYSPKFLLDREAIRPLIRFGRWIFITGLVTMVGAYGLRIVISRQLGTAGLGLYYLASQLAFIPGEVASELVGNVAFPLYARIKKDVAQATRVFKAIFTSLAALLYPACALLIVLAPSLTHYVLGSEWAGTETLIQILALVAMIGIFGEAAIPVLKGFGQPYRITILELVQSVTIISLVYLLTSRIGLEGAALAWLPAVLLSMLLNMRFLKQILSEPFSGLQRQIAAVLVVALISAAVAGGIQLAVAGLVGLIVAALAAVLAGGSLLLFWDRRFNLGFLRNFTWAFPQIANLLRISPQKT